MALTSFILWLCLPHHRWAALRRVRCLRRDRLFDCIVTGSTALNT